MSTQSCSCSTSHTSTVCLLCVSNLSLFFSCKCLSFLLKKMYFYMLFIHFLPCKISWNELLENLFVGTVSAGLLEKKNAVVNSLLKLYLPVALLRCVCVCCSLLPYWIKSNTSLWCHCDTVLVSKSTSSLNQCVCHYPACTQHRNAGVQVFCCR